MSAPITEDATAFAALIRPMTALIGLDLGTKTIGIAVSDLLQSVATPRTTVKRRKFTLDAEAVEAEIVDVFDVGCASLTQLYV